MDRIVVNERTVAAELDRTEIPKQHHDVLQELGQCYAALAEYDRARTCYREAAAVAPAEPGPYVGLGLLAVQEGLPDAARDFFETAVEICHDCAEAYAGLAVVYQKTGVYHVALEMYLKCLELNSDNLVALLGLFQTSCQMGTFAKVIFYLEVYLEKHPGDTSVLFCLATLYAREGRFEQARESLTDVLALEPHKDEAARLLGDVEEQMGQTLAQGSASQ